MGGKARGYTEWRVVALVSIMLLETYFGWPRVGDRFFLGSPYSTGNANIRGTEAHLCRHRTDNRRLTLHLRSRLRFGLS